MKLVLGLSLLLATLAYGKISKECGPDKECIIEVAGTQCADGTPSYITLTERKNAKNLLIYLKGGGGCWSEQSCKNGLAKPLTREETPTNWTTGNGIHNKSDSANPFGEEYNVITIPYCTGDAYTGSNTMNYGTKRAPYVIRHTGYQNVVKSLDAVKALYPAPEKAVLLGCSAGGIGAFYHFRNFQAAFDKSKKYVITDAGTPFKPPYIYPTNYTNVMKAWGADKTLPVMNGKAVTNFGQVVGFNTKEFADTRFGFISSYRDSVMSFFAFSVGASSPLTAVKNTIVDVADNDIGRDTTHARVFFTETSRHCHTPEPLGEVTSLKTDLGTWLTALVEDNHSWTSSRPDLTRKVLSAEEAGEQLEMFIP